MFSQSQVTHLRKRKVDAIVWLKMMHDFNAVSIDPLFSPFWIEGEEKGELWNRIMLHHIHGDPPKENAWKQL